MISPVFGNNEPQISRNFGLRSVGVCFAYPSFDKPFLKVYADERRLNDTAQPPQRTQRTQSIARIIFATFALFAVRFICHLNLLLDNTIEAIGGA